MPRDWEVRMSDLTPVQILVHLALRRDVIDIEEWKTSLLQQMRRIYEHELTAMAARVGCPGRSAMIGEGAILSELNDQAQEWATGICNTFNYDACSAIETIRSDVPTANRHVYAYRLKKWEAARNQWKIPQIAEFTEGWTRSKAQTDFKSHNGTVGMARLVPFHGVCPVCLAMIARGWMPLREALADSPPWHPNCPHTWELDPDKVPPDQCPLLWMGEG